MDELEQKLGNEPPGVVQLGNSVSQCGHDTVGQSAVEVAQGVANGVDGVTYLQLVGVAQLGGHKAAALRLEDGQIQLLVITHQGGVANCAEMSRLAAVSAWRIALRNAVWSEEPWALMTGFWMPKNWVPPISR